MKQEINMEEKQVGTENTEEIQTVSQAWDQSEIMDMRMNTLLKPLMYAMTVMGSHHTNSPVSSESKPSRQCLNRKQYILILYRIVLFSVFLVILTKNLVSFGYISYYYFEYNGLYTLWITQCFVWFCIFCKAFTKYGKQQAAFHTWDTIICKTFAELHLVYPVKKVQLRVKIKLIIGITVIILNLTGAGMQFKFSEVIETQAIPFETNWYIMVILLFFQLVCSVLWILPNLYASTIAMILKNAFKVVTKAIQDALKTNSCQVPPNFQKLRILHLQLCSLLGDFDRDLSWYYGTLCVWHLGTSCFGLYQILRTSLDTLSLVMYICWVISCLALLGFGTSYAATVNDEAHAPLDTIYYINVSDVNFEKLAQINLFLSKLTGTQVGFSTCGLLIITKEFILTIAGVFLTYFAVLYTL